MKITTFTTPERPIYYAAPQSSDTAFGRILILGNAYGIMPYQQNLALELAHEGFEAIWFPFSGQPGSTSGTFSIRSGARDIAQVLASVNQLLGSSDVPIIILAHCASGLITMEYLKTTPDSGVGKVIAYSLLARPVRLKVTAEERLKSQA